ncbi:putative Thioredoxin [Pseudomonas syringae pv. helianthi]|uniref:Thioredoxin n=3 Tax=Pseudomonas syringae group TaxID=136849 RepID=A0A0P9RB60_9PSED|nr:putative Thioredoxin [Pseudomonas syringae pv. helianthi]
MCITRRGERGGEDDIPLPTPLSALPCWPYSWPHSDSSRRAMSQETAYIFDATTANFDQLVIDKSFDQPVLVDFWAEWCAPCKVLMPLLQQITESYQGELLLAKVNCDIEQDIVARFGIRSLPTVVLFKDGQPVDGFAGAQPESEIRKILEQHVVMPPPPAGDPFKQAQELFAESRFAEAEAQLKVLLSEDNTHAAALILYARCLAERGELSEAKAVLDAVTGDAHKAELAGAKAQLTFLAESATLPDAADLKSRLAQNPQDDEAAHQLAIQQLSRQQYEAALDGLLKLFIRNRNYAEGLPHKTLLQVFDLLGNEHPLVTAYRRKLFAALY